MFSIQQLMKSTRKLQASSVSSVSSADLTKNLKHTVIAGQNNNTQHYQTTHLESGSLLAMTSALRAPDMTSTTSSLLSLPQQQQTNVTSQQQYREEQNSNELKVCQRIKNTNSSSSNSYEFSLCSHLNESSSPKHNSNKSNSNTQEQKLTTISNNKNTNTNTTTKTSRITSQHFCNHSQQIQNFYQQQLHQFHTQANQSLWAKQKQTHFTMSSLAAAEPLSTLKATDDIAAAAAATTSTTNGDNGVAENSTTSMTNKDNKTCFKSGYPEILQFMELIGNLKHTKRTGWVLRDVNDCESISGHMYRMSMMTFLLDGTEGLNQIRCMELALVHDLAESIVGDLTPFCGISKEEKRAMEFKAMDDICKLIEPRGKRIMELFVEYETGESAESKFVKDLDRLDMIMQAFEYEKRDNCLLKHQEFFDSTEGKFKHPFVQQLVKEIYAQRIKLANEKGATPPPNIVVPDWENAAATSTSNQNNGHCSKQQTAAASELQEEQSSSSTSTS